MGGKLAAERRVGLLPEIAAAVLINEELGSRLVTHSSGTGALPPGGGERPEDGTVARLEGERLFSAVLHRIEGQRGGKKSAGG